MLKINNLNERVNFKMLLNTCEMEKKKHLQITHASCVYIVCIAVHAFNRLPIVSRVI